MKKQKRFKNIIYLKSGRFIDFESNKKFSIDWKKDILQLITNKKDLFIPMKNIDFIERRQRADKK